MYAKIFVVDYMYTVFKTLIQFYEDITNVYLWMQSSNQRKLL